MRWELEGLPQPNWFHHGEQILALLEDRRPMHCVELGSNRGCSAIATARLIWQWGGRVTCVDRWIEGPSEVAIGVFAENIVAAGVSGSIRMIRATTEAAARDWHDGHIDYLYIDAGHTKAECLLDLKLWWPLLRYGGLIAGDDYDDPDGIPSEGVTAAWDEFEQTYRLQFNRTATPGLKSRLIWGVKC